MSDEMTDSDPSDYECSNCIGTQSKTFYSYYECDGCYEPVGAVECVPVEALEDLVQEWREQASEGTGEISSSTYLKTRATYYRRCADELEALITDYTND